MLENHSQQFYQAHKIGLVEEIQKMYNLSIRLGSYRMANPKPICFSFASKNDLLISFEADLLGKSSIALRKHTASLVKTQDTLKRLYRQAQNVNHQC